MTRSTGAWVNRDPIGEKGGLNLYGMVRNDAVNFADVLGLFPAIGHRRPLLLPSVLRFRCLRGPDTTGICRGSKRYSFAMSITVELDLSQAVAERAKAEGLVRSEVLSGLVERELGRRKARANFGEQFVQLHSVTGDEMSPGELQAEIQAVRASRREGGR